MLKERSELKFEARHKGFSYQLQAIEAVKSLPYAALFHEQGLGKTKIGLDLAMEWLKSNTIDSVVIVTKRGLIQNWIEEIKTHTYLSARILGQNRQSNFFSLNSPSRIYLTHYEAVKSEERRLSLFLKTRRVGAILDEAHKIKNPDSDVAKVFHRISPQFERKVIMTGTPVANRPYDLWSQVYFLDAGQSLGRDFKEFQKQLDLSNDLWADEEKREAFERTLSTTFEKISKFSVRQRKDSAGIDLPEKIVENVIVELAPRQKFLYQQYKTELQASIIQDGQQISDDAEEALKRLLRLVQVASNPALIDDSYDEEPGKFSKLSELVDRAVKRTEKTIVWTSFVYNAEWLRKKLRAHGSVAISGGMTHEDRIASVKAFKEDPDCKVLIATPGAAKEGLTLTVANHAVFYDRSFSLDDYLQAQDRIHRISQKQTCFIWNLLGRDTVDEWVDSLLAAKRLSAQLAQADISLSEYKRLANYDFGKTVREILGLGGDEE
ncbi:DEAD/DEAH box helicase [Ferrovibrio sp.]|uniref:DEAD/DEAH box helicase n=1 Tax=Ferrovibrio sp. TaxID=1917215 RepID=UPI00311E6DCE